MDPSATLRQPSQGRLFDPDRYSPVTVAVWIRLPESSARAFAIASALGSIRGGQGSTGRLRGGRDAAGTYVTRRRLEAVLQAIDLDRRQWRRYVKEWIELYLAHRCQWGEVFLFARPVFSECPNCRIRLEIDHVPEHAKRTRAAREAVQQPQERLLNSRESGANTAARGGRIQPLLERESDTPNRRFLLGVEEGVEDEIQAAKERIPSHVTDGMTKEEGEALTLACAMLGASPIVGNQRGAGRNLRRRPPSDTPLYPSSRVLGTGVSRHETEVRPPGARES